MRQSAPQDTAPVEKDDEATGTRHPHRHLIPVGWWLRRTYLVPTVCFVFLLSFYGPGHDSDQISLLWVVLNAAAAQVAGVGYGLLTWCVAAWATPKVTHD